MAAAAERFVNTEIANTPAALTRLLDKLVEPAAVLRLCYEVGPCGYGIQRHLSAAGHDCVVVAPSLILRRPGDRIKTDRRDTINLAKLLRAGELTAVWILMPSARKAGQKHPGRQNITLLMTLRRMTAQAA
jgi:transposase